MLKAIAGLWPLALGLAAIGGSIWFFLAREMELGRWLFGVFLVAHGLVHALFIVPAPAARAGAAEWPFVISRSWLVTLAKLDLRAVRLAATGLVCAVVLASLLAGLATVGILVPAGRWQVVMLVSTGTSVALLSLFPNRQLVLGLAVDATLLWVVLGAVWVPMPGS